MLLEARRAIAGFQRVTEASHDRWERAVEACVADRLAESIAAR